MEEAMRKTNNKINNGIAHIFGFLNGNTDRNIRGKHNITELCIVDKSSTTITERKTFLLRIHIKHNNNAAITSDWRIIEKLRRNKWLFSIYNAIANQYQLVGTHSLIKM